MNTLCIFAVAFSLVQTTTDSTTDSTTDATTDATAVPTEWNDLIDWYINAYKSVQKPKKTVFPQMGERVETLFRSHRLSHIQIFSEQHGKRHLSADVYYGQDELHIVSHEKGWNLVTRGSEGFEWKTGQKTGQIIAVKPKDLVDYTMYLTDPALFCTYMYGVYLTQPDRYEDPRPGESGWTELRLKDPKNGLLSIQVDEKRFWYGALETQHPQTNTVTKMIFSKPKAIDQIPKEVFEPLESIRFQKSKKSLRRHMTYL